MADAGLSQASTTPDEEAWPELFRQQVARNARFWSEQIRTRPVGTPLLHTERDNIVKALNRALQLEAAWATVVDLLVDLSTLAVRYPAIGELDFNPIFVQDKGLKIGDVRIIAIPSGV